MKLTGDDYDYLEFSKNFLNANKKHVLPKQNEISYVTPKIVDNIQEAHMSNF